MANIFEETFECDGECGASFTVKSREKRDVHQSVMHSLAEILGYKTVHKTKGDTAPDIFCPFCQARAKKIVEGQ